MGRKICVGISFDEDILLQIDKERGEISRSRYLLKLLHKLVNGKKNGNSFESDPVKSGSSDAIAG